MNLRRAAATVSTMAISVLAMAQSTATQPSDSAAVGSANLSAVNHANAVYLVDRDDPPVAPLPRVPGAASIRPPSNASGAVPAVTPHQANPAPVARRPGDHQFHQGERYYFRVVSGHHYVRRHGLRHLVNDFSFHQIDGSETMTEYEVASFDRGYGVYVIFNGRRVRITFDTSVMQRLRREARASKNDGWTYTPVPEVPSPPTDLPPASAPPPSPPLTTPGSEPQPEPPRTPPQPPTESVPPRVSPVTPDVPQGPLSQPTPTRPADVVTVNHPPVNSSAYVGLGNWYQSNETGKGCVYNSQNGLFGDTVLLFGGESGNWSLDGATYLNPNGRNGVYGIRLKNDWHTGAFEFGYRTTSGVNQIWFNPVALGYQGTTEDPCAAGIYGIVPRSEHVNMFQWRQGTVAQNVTGTVYRFSDGFPDTKTHYRLAVTAPFDHGNGSATAAYDSGKPGGGFDLNAQWTARNADKWSGQLYANSQYRFEYLSWERRLNTQGDYFAAALAGDNWGRNMSGLELGTRRHVSKGLSFYAGIKVNPFEKFRTGVTLGFGLRL